MKGLLIYIIVACFIGFGSLLTFAPDANSAVITFEDRYPGYETDSIPIPAGYEGFTWSDDVYGITKHRRPGSGYEYGTIGLVSIYTGGANDIYMLDGTFDFNGAYITAAWDSTEDVIVEGWFGGSMIYNTTITTHNDAPYWFDFNFLNVDRIWFKPQGSHIDIDNITYNETAAPIPEPITTTIDIEPDTLNLKSKGKWITCYIELPEGYDVYDIEVETVELEYTISAEASPTEVGDNDNDDDGIPDLMVKFDRQVLIDYLGDTTGDVTLTVIGELADETPFEGSDTIRVIKEGK